MLRKLIPFIIILSMTVPAYAAWKMNPHSGKLDYYQGSTEMVYDNGTSGMTADTVQEALDEIAANIATITTTGLNLAGIEVTTTTTGIDEKYILMENAGSAEKMTGENILDWIAADGGFESHTSNDIDPDRLAGDTVDDNKIDAAIIADLSASYLAIGADIVAATGNNAFTIDSDDDNADTLVLRAYDVNQSAYDSMITLTSANEPTIAMAADGTIALASGGNTTINGITALTGAIGTVSVGGNFYLGGDLYASNGNSPLDIFPDDESGDTLRLLARDIDGSAWDVVLTITNGNTPTLAIATDGNTTINGATLATGTSGLVTLGGSLSMTGDILGTAGNNAFTISADVDDTDTLVLQAYDVDGTAYDGVVTITSGNTPTLTLAADGGIIASSVIRTSGGLTVTNGTALDLSNITMSAATDEGLALPIWADVTPTTTSKRWMAWDENGGVAKVYTAGGWQEIGSGTGGSAPTFDAVATGTNVSSTMTVGSGASLVRSGTGIIDANRFLGVTSIDATEFGYLDGITGSLQEQLDSKAASTHLHSAADVTSGVLDNARINWAAPGAIGGEIPGPITGTTITGPSFVSTAADGEHYIDLVNTVPITATASLGLLAYYNGVYWISDADDWTTDFLIDNGAFTGNTETGIEVTPQSDGTVDFVLSGGLPSIGGLTETAGGLLYMTADDTYAVLGEGSNDGYVLAINTTTHEPYWKADATGAGGDQLVDIVTTAPLLVNGGANVDDALPGSDADITFSVSAATDSASGVVELSTDAESVTGTSDSVVVTPGTLTARLAAPGAIGGTTPAAGTFTTLSAGATGFSVDADGDVTGKSFSVTQSASQAGQWYGSELSGNGTDYQAWEVADEITTSLVLKFPNANPLANSIQIFGAPSDGKSTFAWLQLTGNSKYFGTDGSGTVGIHDLPAASSGLPEGGTAGQIIVKTESGAEWQNFEDQPAYTTLLNAFLAAGLNTFTFTPDTPASYPYYSATGTFNLDFEVTDTSTSYTIAGVRYQLDEDGYDGNSASDQGSNIWRVALADLTEDTYTLQLEATDNKGTPNTGESSEYTVIVDTTDPVINLSAGANPTTHDGTGTDTWDLQIGMITETYIDSIQYRLTVDGGETPEWSTWSPTWTTTGISLPEETEDLHIAVKVTDLAGNWDTGGITVPVSGGGGTTAYIGWSTNGATTDAPSSDSIISPGGSRTDVNAWTANTDGTAKKIRYYFRDYYTATNVTMGLWNGTTLIGTASIIPAANSWVWSSDLVVESGQSLDFSTNDVLRFGPSINNATVNGFQVTGGGGATGNWDRHADAYLPNPATWADISTNTAGAILEYEY